MNRSNFLVAGASAVVQATLARKANAVIDRPRETTPADYHLTIEPCTLDVGPRVSVRTVAYDGQVPGPMLKLREGIPVSIDVTNRVSWPEIVHRHGLKTDSINDGAMEERSPMIGPGETHRYHLYPQPFGSRWYHTHASAYGDLSRGTYTGQFGFLSTEGRQLQEQVDREIVFVMHHFEPAFVPMVEGMREQSTNSPLTNGSDVGYRYATVNGHMLGAGEPLRVRQDERILFRLLNASATDNLLLALPGHSFKVIAMDGNPVPKPHMVSVLSLAVAERIDALVEMNSPGLWIFGSTLAKERATGLGIVVEYSGKTGAPVWRDAPLETWNYAAFASNARAPEPDETIELTIRDIGPPKGSQFDTWTINNQSWPSISPINVSVGKHNRLVFRNGSGDQHPVHVHRHTFEVVRIGDTNMSGLRKDVVNLMPLDEVAVDFLADNPGDTLWHCYQQLHMDYGFMQLIRYMG